MINFLKKIFGTAQSRQLKKYYKVVDLVNRGEESYQKLSEEQVIAKTQEFKERYLKGESLDSLLPEAYGVVKNICRKMCGTEFHVSGYDQKWDMVPYDVQILGAIAMHHGSISEMQTGEGKTLTASMPLYLNALTGQPVHLVTVNDYLAKRDCEWIGSVFKKLGITVANLTNDVPPNDRKEIYKADIVYGTASEFGFDYLRDNSMVSSKNDQCQRKPYYFAIVDEIDSILIDEARTPLIISGPVAESRQMYDILKDSVSTLVTLQRNFCNSLASEARKTLDSLGLLSSKEGGLKLSKQQEKEKQEVFQKLWIVGKGTPRSKILKRIKENPDLRAEIEKIETYYYSDQNKEEKSKELSKLFIIIDERSSDFELTDNGVNAWIKNSNNENAANDFVMLDLGDGYAKIDEDNSLSEQEKIAKKVKLKEDDANRKERSHNLRQLFRAHLLMEKDVDYIVQDSKIIIIDENTGRPQPGRRFSDGLHQAIEAKESLAIQSETQTYATITLQNYFRMYEKLAGMTGTAITEANEFKEIYKLEVLEIPSYCSCKRKDSDDEIYMTEREKYIAILKEIQKINKENKPILIGTESVEISEKLSRILRQNKLSHTVLNAKNHEKEAEIISQAGKAGSITLATNMAGRGTDIKLSKEASEVKGLHVIGTTRHHSRRIDRQLRGRSGRLGDPGSSKFFVSFEDSLMRLFASPRITTMLQRFRPPEGEPISAKMLNKSIETAQKRIEQRNYTIRKHTLEYDDVMNKQRQEIYHFRNDILSNDNPSEIAKELIDSVCSIKASEYLIDKALEDSWKIEEYRNWLMTHFPVTFDKKDFDDDYLEINEIEQIAATKVIETFEKKLHYQKQLITELTKEENNENKSEEVLFEVIRNIMIRKIDQLWQEHLLAIDHLRSDVSLRSIGQKDPLLEFKQEAFFLFANFSTQLRLDITKDLFRFEMVKPQRSKLEESLANLQLHTQKSFVPQPEETNNTKEEIADTPITVDKKAKRNEMCPCGSGKKYKKCCGATTEVSS
jgi:preprotein translocase subunit SecA